MSTKNQSLRVISISMVLLVVLVLSACGSQATSTTAPTQAATGSNTPEEPEQADVAKPSNSGGPGEAVNLTGDLKAGEQIFTTNCVACHGQSGQGGVANPGSTDGSIPPLNPIDPTLVSSDMKTYATNLDLFIEHGSTPEGTKPQVSMLAFGDNKTLTPQQIADVIAYVISINKK